MEKRIKKYTIICVVICFLGIGIIGFYNSNSSLQANQTPVSQVQESVKEDQQEKKQEENEENVVSETTSIDEEQTTSKTQTNHSDNQSSSQKNTQENQSSVSSSQKETSSTTSTSENQQSPAVGNESTEALLKVSLTIQGIDSIIGNGNIEVEEGNSVYDVLKLYTDQNGIEMKATSSIYGKYITEIAGLKEKEHGGSSGWMYYVNGQYVPRSCDACKVKDGDQILWFYVYSD